MINMTMTSCILLPVIVFISCVAAHGHVSTLTVDGKTVSSGVIRTVSSDGPVKGANNPFLNCGLNASLAPHVVSVNPGSRLTFKWEDKAAANGNWIHFVGPLMSYLTNCGSTTCDKFDSTNAEWFKISEIGLKSNASWFQRHVFDGQVANVTLPSNIAPGNYIIRHEIVALHLGDKQGGAEFYPSCSQLHMSGSGTGAPTPAELVKFPGAYSDSDPGIFVPDIFNNDFSNYLFPGPPVASFVASSTPSSSNTSSGTSSSSIITLNPANMPSTRNKPADTGASTSPSISGNCASKKKRMDHVSLGRNLARVSSF